MAIISNENLPTVTAVAFVLALLGLALTSYNTIRLNQTVAAVAAFEVGDANQESADKAAMDAKLKALEDRLAQVEAKAAAPAAPADDAAAAAE